MPRLLDLFSGAGGSAVGYHRAGFDEIVGIDIVDQPRYPFHFIKGDALRPPVRLEDFDLIHASPPCQAYSSASPRHNNHPDYYAATRSMLEAAAKPYAIENVVGAPYHHGVVLCGSMFDLVDSDGEWVRRHRNFETSWLSFQPACIHPTRQRALLVTGHAFIRSVRDIKNHSRQGPFDLACRLMGIDWMTRKELVQAIPPAYTEYIGRQFLDQMARA